MANLITPDQAHARATVAAMTALVDIQDWQALERCFADRLTLDYTSLWGGEAQDVSRDELLGQWQGLLPGFDATWHELGPVAISVQGDRANAEAPVSGTHLLGGKAWIVEGRYSCGLVRESGEWRIASLAYANENETGDRALAEEAKTRVATCGQAEKRPA